MICHIFTALALLSLACRVYNSSEGIGGYLSHNVECLKFYFTRLASKAGVPRCAAVRWLRMDDRARALIRRGSQGLLGERASRLAGTGGWGPSRFCAPLYRRRRTDKC